MSEKNELNTFIRNNAIYQDGSFKMSSSNGAAQDKLAIEVRHEFERLHDMASLLPSLLHLTNPDLSRKEFYKLVVDNESYEFVILTKQFAQQLIWDWINPFWNSCKKQKKQRHDSSSFLFLLNITIFTVFTAK